MYANCPIIWCSKLQTQIALSTTEVEYIAISQSLQDTIPMMHLLREINSNRFHTLSTVPEVYCKAFKDNSGALELARTTKMRPCIKHINQFYHNFCDFVRNGTIQIFLIKSQNHIVNIFMKPLAHNDFLHHCNKLLRWQRKIIYATPRLENINKI